jgi:nitroimidazol reductase NimA-like FMN-containing flavoprotein (pyridoxamine 5'-phosphate oxidase superfamily)
MITNLKEEECSHLLSNNYIGQLAYIYKERPFVVPITYFFKNDNFIIVGYSDDGHKTRAMRKNNKVSLQVSDIKDSDNWISVLAHGVYEEVTGSEAKKYLHDFSTGIKDIILRKEDRYMHSIADFSSKKYTNHPPIIFRVTVDEMTGKRRIHS